MKTRQQRAAERQQKALTDAATKAIEAALRLAVMGALILGGIFYLALR